MQAHNYKTESAVLAVEGTLWCGQPDTAHEYPLTRIAHPKTMAEAKRIAGDFQDLDSAQVVITRREIKETVETIALTV